MNIKHHLNYDEETEILSAQLTQNRINQQNQQGEKGDSKQNTITNTQFTCVCIGEIKT